jgi:hypothetical protein
VSSQSAPVTCQRVLVVGSLIAESSIAPGSS